MCLIVTLFFPFLIEVCWLICCVVYTLCKITQLDKQDNRKCIFATDGILEQNSVRCAFKCVSTVTCLIMAAPHWCFLRNAMVVYPCDIHKVSRLLTGKKGHLKKEVLRRNDDQFWIWPISRISQGYIGLKALIADTVDRLEV